MNTHLQPWWVSAADSPADGFASDRLEFLLRYAILAPSNHNTQPWRFLINVDDVEVFTDHRRALPAVDPYGRELLMACGAAFYNLRVAAEYFGQNYDLQLLPDPQRSLLAGRFVLKPGKMDTRSEDVLLFHAITERRTNREPFRQDPVPVEALEQLTAAAAAENAWLGIAVEPDHRNTLGALIAEADRIQWKKGAFRKELAAWMRSDPEHCSDGILTRDIGVVDWLAFAGPALVRTFSRGHHQAARDEEIAIHSPAMLVLGTDADDPMAWLQAGQALESVLLCLQSNGLAASHLNQPIEVDELRPRVAESMGHPQGFPQALLRIGYGPTIPPAPRRSLQDFLVRQDPTKAPPH